MGRPGTIINLAGRAWASLEARGLARYAPLANLGRAGTILIRAGPSRARARPARPAYLDIYKRSTCYMLVLVRRKQLHEPKAQYTSTKKLCIDGLEPFL
jgi:hypothetical protein